MEKKTPYAPDNLIQRPLTHYLEAFQKADPSEIAARTGVSREGNTFLLYVLGEEKRVTWPDFQDDNWKDKDRILFLRYLTEGKKTEPVSTFSAYRELPWGEVYDRNFRARCISRFTGMFGTNADGFRKAAEKLHGTEVPGSGLIYEIPFMDEMKLKFILWEGDDEFPASAQILFSDNFPEAFSAEDRVILCEYVLSRMR